MTQHSEYPQSLPDIEEQIPTTEEGQTIWKKIGLIVLVVILLGLLITGLVLLLQPGTDTARVRDIFIIFMALEFLVIGLALVILIVQLARLTYLLQNEVQPILESSRETADTLRGTAAFLSENLVEPVMKFNEYLAGMTRFFRFFHSEKKK